VNKLRFVFARFVMGWDVEEYGDCSCLHAGVDHLSGHEPYEGQFDCALMDCPCGKWNPVKYRWDEWRKRETFAKYKPVYSSWRDWWKREGRNRMYDLKYRFGLYFDPPSYESVIAQSRIDDLAREQWPDDDSDVEDDPDPWDGNETLRHALEYAGWRYAILIGITDPLPDDDLPLSMREEDARKYAHLISKTPDGQAIWHCEEATAFVSELTGASREISARWLDYDWPA